ncbi:MAG TPA: hypothetical protein VLC08_16045, partial [Chitinolyticbacter sp.]|nr:hypothetical protein [Chitinolyticbacter sp.]
AVHQDERKRILDSIRPVAVREAGQPVRIKVDRLNVDGEWAVLVGSLVGQPNKVLDWNLSASCDTDLDKMLWVVLKRNKMVWSVKHIEICASEPPYWYLEQYGGFVWPCGVYAGLENGEEADLEAQCREYSKPISPMVK